MERGFSTLDALLALGFFSLFSLATFQETRAILRLHSRSTSYEQALRDAQNLQTLLATKKYSDAMTAPDAFGPKLHCAEFRCNNEKVVLNGSMTAQCSCQTEHRRSAQTLTFNTLFIP